MKIKQLEFEFVESIYNDITNLCKEWVNGELQWHEQKLRVRIKRLIRKYWIVDMTEEDAESLRRVVTVIIRNVDTSTDYSTMRSELLFFLARNVTFYKR